MTANPSLNAVIGTTNFSYITFLSLVENTGTDGMVLFRMFNKDSGTCTLVSAGDREQCIKSTIDTYIPGLYRKVVQYSLAGTTFSVGCARTYVCTTGDVCSPPSCTSYSTSSASINDNVNVDIGLGNTPDPVSNYTLTPGNMSITATWTAPSNAPIACYNISLFQGTTLLSSGFIKTTTKTIGNLTNGTTYIVEVVAVSDDNYSSSVQSRSAVPVSSCAVPICGFGLS